MKKFLLAFSILCSLSYGSGEGVMLLGSSMGTLVSQNLMTAPLSSAYTGGNALFASGLTGKSSICLYNGGTTLLEGATSNSTCDGSTVSNFIIPPNGGTTCLERATVKTYICLKTASFTNGVFATPW